MKCVFDMLKEMKWPLFFYLGKHKNSHRLREGVQEWLMGTAQESIKRAEAAQRPSLTPPGKARPSRCRTQLLEQTEQAWGEGRLSH